MGAELLAAGGIGAILATFFDKVKSFFLQLRSILIGVIDLPVSGEVYLKYISKHKGINWGDKGYEFYWNYVNGKSVELYDCKYKNKKIIRFIPSPVFVSYNYSIKIVYIRYITNTDKIVKELFEINKEETTKRDDISDRCSSIFHVNGSLGDKDNGSKDESAYSRTPTTSGELVAEANKGDTVSTSIHIKYSKKLCSYLFSSNITKPFDDLYYDKETLEVIQCLDTWLKLETWYASKRIPWKRGLLLHGKPGTGKTSLVRALGEKYSLDIHSFRLSTFSDSEFTDTVFERARNTRPKIFLFEDADVFFESRKTNNNNTMRSPLTFSTFINTIDGVKPLDKVFIVITTNCLDKLDSALLRPGRVDDVIELKPLNQEGKNKIAQFILGEWTDMADSMSSLEGEFTGAEFKELCVKEALNKKWAEMAKTIDNPTTM